jgi:hypothetical protein
VARSRTGGNSRMLLAARSFPVGIQFGWWMIGAPATAAPMPQHRGRGPQP